MTHVALVTAKVIALLLGLVIAAQAYRGYRRHDSWPMLYLAVGFAVISVGTAVEGILFELLGVPIQTASAIQTAIVTLGMLVVLYSLYAKAPLGAR
ncbi:MAG TPA: hypothetical protein VKA37_00780 [Halobacteriales archaeon]|nr:hypothetical protein [Halobacteriales archaeon]